jgi:hypothetical protein
MNAKVEMQAAWDLHEGLVLGTACKFYRQYGGDLEEIKADALYHFAEACQDYEERSPLGYWIGQKVWWGLLDERKQLRKRRTHEAAAALPDSSYEQRHDLDWRDGLTEDAKTIVEATLDPPPDVQILLSARAYKPVAKHVLKKYLRDCGWSQRRIHRAFREVEQLVA